MVLGLCAGACRSADDSSAAPARAGGLVAELSGTRPERTIAPRLSIPVVYHPCTSTTPTAGTVPRTVCKPSAPFHTPSPALLDLAQRASARVHADGDPAALQTAALIDLIWTPEERIPVERSVAYLRAAARLAARPAPILADLAAALLVRAERDQAPRDLLDAIESADHALELEARDSAARFNLALGLDLLGLDAQAAAAWRDYLRVDSTSDWAAEARRRAQPRSEATSPATPDSSASPSDFEQYALAAPGEALQLGWHNLLGAWAEGVIAGDRNRAARALDRARAV
ncbi:MAG TPA: hypothetical protein VK688_06240, partial [Gemmatimonadales bacterium]|nr:hypothetical protein [Gemmatimonadales bacterium]